MCRSPLGRHRWFRWCRSEPVLVWGQATSGSNTEGSSMMVASVHPLVGSEQVGGSGSGWSPSNS